MTVKKKLFMATSIGFIIGLLAAFIIFRIIVGTFSKLGEHKLGDVDVPIAEKNIEAYQDKLAYLKLSFHPDDKLKCIVYDTTEFKKYYNQFSEFKETHRLPDDSPHLSWQVGLYPNVCYDPIRKENRLGIYFIPTLVRSLDSPIIRESIIEYFSTLKDNSNYRRYYNGPETTKKAPVSYVKDQGTLFP